MRFVKAMAALLLMVFLLASTAAAEVHGWLVYQPETNTLEIDCYGLNDGQDYALLVLRSADGVLSDLAEENLLMLDQLKAGENGILCVAMIYPDLPECTVLLGGEFDGQESPVMLGEPVSLDNALIPPETMTTIGDEAFMGMSFTCVYIGQTVKSIGARAFKDCSELTAVFIPESVTFIGEDAFANCSNLEIICHEGSAASEYAAANGISCRVK